MSAAAAEYLTGVGAADGCGVAARWLGLLKLGSGADGSEGSSKVSGTGSGRGGDVISSSSSSGCVGGSGKSGLARF